MKLSELFHNCAYDVKYQEVGTSVNYAFVEEGDTLYIYFQGSNSVWDWVENFFFKKVPYKDMEVRYKVHAGFLFAWKQVQDIVIKKVTETKLREPTEEEFNDGFIQVIDYVWKHIVIVGYSHGGALAGLCHECVWYYRPDLRDDGLEGYGFESPRFLGSYHVPKTIKERWEKFTVIRTNNDLVTHCPPWIFRYCHVGNLLKVKGDISLVNKKRLPKCIKSHYPQVVEDGLKKYENN